MGLKLIRPLRRFYIRWTVRSWRMPLIKIYCMYRLCTYRSNEPKHTRFGIFKGAIVRCLVLGEKLSVWEIQSFLRPWYVRSDFGRTMFEIQAFWWCAEKFNVLHNTILGSFHHYYTKAYYALRLNPSPSCHIIWQKSTPTQKKWIVECVSYPMLQVEWPDVNFENSQKMLQIAKK